MSGPLNHDVIISAATRLFRVCVRLYPRRFRVEYGSEMEALFRRRMIRASSAGSAPLMWALLIAFQDVLAGAVAERFPARRTARGHAMFSARSVQGFRAFDGLSLDFKLGGRMLVRYPGLTVIAGLAMAFGICVGTVIFQMMSIFVYPSLPLPQGDRLVQIRNWDVAAKSAEPRALHDFNVWRSTLRSVTELGAWRNVTRNLIVTEGDARPVQVAEITPSAFRVADGTPLMGRVLMEADERPGAPSVAVIGYDVWRTRFGSDPAVLGRTVQLGTEHVTVVGVMREGFAFPIAHEVWTPLRIVNDAHAPRSGPAISVFGLLAPGATLDTAQAELTAVGQRLASEQPATHAQLQPHVAPYAMPDGGPSQDDIGIMASIYFFAVMLLVLICSNVALLLFARAATRESELAVRTALGASRGRIVAQMFAEALVLGGVAAVIGLAAAHLALKNWGLPFLEMNLGRLPFWYDVSLSPTTVLFALGLTVLGSAIAGVMPALKVTRRMGSRLKQATAGAGGLQFGGVWTAVIVVQVAITVAFPAVVYVEQGQLRHIRTFDAGFAAEEYLAVQLAMETPVVAGANGDSDRAAQRAAFASSIEELRRRVAAEPGVAGVTFADWLPRVPDRPWERIELPDQRDRHASRRSRRGRRCPAAAPMGERRAYRAVVLRRAGGADSRRARLRCRRSRAGCECRDRRSGLRGGGAAGAESHRAAGAIRAGSEGYRRQAPQSLDRDRRRREGARDGLTPGEGTRRGVVPSCHPGPIRPGVHDGARSRRSDDAGPTGSRDRGRRGSDAPPGGVAAGGPGPGRHSCGSSGCGCESRS